MSYCLTIWQPLWIVTGLLSKALVLIKPSSTLPMMQDSRPSPVGLIEPKTKGKVESLAKFTTRLKVYNGEFDSFEDLERITEEFVEEINLEVSQATGETPAQRYKKEQEYLSPLPSIHALLSYFSYHKEYKVSKESMVTYKGQKYSVPPRYIGYLLTITESEEAINLYYMEDLVTCHPKSDVFFNYHREHAREILKSDALKYMSDLDIEHFIDENLSKMNMLLR